MSEMSYDSDMFESGNQPKRQPSNIASGSPQKSILKPKKKLEEIWIEEKLSFVPQQRINYVPAAF